MIDAITIEREFGCGASEVASLVASHLGWNLWDETVDTGDCAPDREYARGG